MSTEKHTDDGMTAYERAMLAEARKQTAAIERQAEAAQARGRAEDDLQLRAAVVDRAAVAKQAAAWATRTPEIRFRVSRRCSAPNIGGHVVLGTLVCTRYGESERWPELAGQHRVDRVEQIDTAELEAKWRAHLLEMNAEDIATLERKGETEAIAKLRQQIESPKGFMSVTPEGTPTGTCGVKHALFKYGMSDFVNAVVPSRPATSTKVPVTVESLVKSGDIEIISGPTEPTTPAAPLVYLGDESQ